MKLVIREYVVGTSIVEKTVYNISVIPNDYGKLPMSIFAQKGDLIAGAGIGTPIIKHPGLDGTVLMYDSTKPSGLSDLYVSTSSVNLTNKTASVVQAGTIVIPDGVNSNGFRLATSNDNGPFFIVYANCDPDADAICTGVIGNKAAVRCTESSVSVGDSIYISSTNGLGASSGSKKIGVALSSKSAGYIATVQVVLTETGNITFTNIYVANTSWISDATYSEFPYRASIALAGATSVMTPIVTFSVADAISGNYAPVAQTYDGGIYIYAAVVPSGITIPTIVLM